MKLSPLTKFAIFVAIILGGLGGFGAIWNHNFSSEGTAKVEKLETDVAGHDKAISRHDSALMEHTSALDNHGLRIQDIEIKNEAQDRDIREHTKAIDEHAGRLGAIEKSAAQIEGQLKQAEETIAPLQGGIESLEKQSLEHSQKMTRAIDELRKHNEDLNDRLKRLERLLGADPSN